jgi:serine/threonine-protein kinase
MSPEQWAGKHDIDARADVFSMGVTIYQALTLEFPYGRGRVNAKTPPMQIPATVSRPWPWNLDLVVQKALDPDRERRYGSAAKLREDWQRVHKGLLPQYAKVGAKRRLLDFVGRWAIPATTIGAMASVALLLVLLVKLTAKPARTVQVSTEPPGARVALVPLSELYGTPRFDQALQPGEKTPVVVHRVPPGEYLVVAEVPGHGFHEVFRKVPMPGELPPTLRKRPTKRRTLQPGAVKSPQVDVPQGAGESFPHLEFTEVDGTVIMPTITIPKSGVEEGMALFQGGEFTVGSADYGPAFVPPHTRTVGPFLLDRTEVTVAAYLEVRRDIPEDLRKLSPAAEEAVRFVSFDQAMRCAEQMGKRLPDEWEYEYAATSAGEFRFPWGADFERIEKWDFGPVGLPLYDRPLANPAICGLFSNVAEWTSSWHAPYPGALWTPEQIEINRGQRVVRGGPLSVVNGDSQPAGRDKLERWWDARFRQGFDPDTQKPGLGFRCARSLRPRFP